MKPLTTDRTRLSATALSEAYRAGLGTSHAVKWIGGQSVTATRTAQGFKVTYTTQKRDAGERAAYSDRISVDARPCPMGCVRLFLICPACAKPKAFLYGAAPFACRTCHGLIYPSQAELHIFARYDTGQAIAYKLAGRFVTFDEPFPDRPPGMHLRTYEAKRAKWERLTRPARVFAGTHGLGDLADHSDARGACRVYCMAMEEKREKQERREAYLTGETTNEYVYGRKRFL